MKDMTNDVNPEAYSDQVGGYAPLQIDELMGIEGTSNSDYETDQVLGDTLKVEYIDENDKGEVNRGGIWLKQDVTTKMWRVARIVKRGPLAPKELQIGTLIRFPSDKGLPAIASGKKYTYLNASRVFETVIPVKR